MNTPSLLGRRFQVDFARNRTPAAPAAWPMLALGAVVLAWALADFAPRWAQHERLRRERSELIARLDRLQGVARTSARSADPAAAEQARTVLDQLQRPWPALFDQFESINAPDVHLVQLAVDARFRSVQVLAEAPGLEPVLRFSHDVSGKGPARQMRLTHHELRAAPSGRIVVADLTADLAAGVADGEVP